MRWLLFVSLLSLHAAADPPLWPVAQAPLTLLEPGAPKPPRRWRVLVDGGHGNPGNDGNTSLDCEKEAVVMGRLAEGLAARLERDARFEVRLTRRGDEAPGYHARLQQADDWPADALVSLHSDVRNGGTPEWRRGLCVGYRNDTAPGFAVLWSDEGSAPLAARRGLLARTVASAMRHAGFGAYRGEDYPGLYDDDAENPGVFVDRHLPGQRIFLLRRPHVPSVIIETHHAWDSREIERWREPRTQDAFAAAVATGLLQALRP